MLLHPVSSFFPMWGFLNGTSGWVIYNASSPEHRQLSFSPRKPYDLLAAPRLEKSPSPASSIPPSYMSPGWKERDPNSSPMHNTIVGEVISRYLFLPQPDHRPLISTTQMLSPEPLLTDNWIVKGNWWRSGGIISVPSSTPGHHNFLGSPDTRILAKQNSKPTYRKFLSLWICKPVIWSNIGHNHQWGSEEDWLHGDSRGSARRHAGYRLTHRDFTSH